MSKLLKGIGATALTAGLLVGGAAPAFASTPVYKGGHHGHGTKIIKNTKNIKKDIKVDTDIDITNSFNECNQVVVAKFIAKANCNNGTDIF